MNVIKSKLLKKQAGLLLLAFGLIVVWLGGCGKNTDQKGVVDPTVTTVPFTTTPTSTPTWTPTPTLSPTPTPKPWEYYEKVGDKGVYRVPVKELTSDCWIGNSSCGGDYVLLNLIKRVEPDEAVTGTVLLLRPELSGEAVALQTDYYVRSCKVISDGTVFVEEENATVHVLDAELKEINRIIPDANSSEFVFSITEDGHIWKSDIESGRLSVCDRYGENTRVYKLIDDRYAFQDLGEKDNKRYFLASSATVEPYEVVVCLDITSGESNIVQEKTVNVINGEEEACYSTSGGIVRDFSNDTWYLHFIGENGRRISFPCCYQYENIDYVSGDLLCTSGRISGVNSEYDSWKVYKGCSVYDTKEKALLGKISAYDIEPYNNIYTFGVSENGMVYMIGAITNGSGTDTGALLMWDLNTQEPAPITGFFEYEGNDIEAGLTKLAEEYREVYGISYTPSKMKTIVCDDNIEAMKAIDLLNMLARGIKDNPEEFPKDEEGIALRLENIHGHERGHAEFNPYIFSKMNTDYYGEEQMRDFYKLVDALRAGEEYYDSQKRTCYNTSLVWLTQWYYPVSTTIIQTSYDYTDKKQWKKGKGKIYYTVPLEEAAERVQEFEQLTLDALDDSFGDDYTDFEKSLALYEYITSNWKYDYDLYYHISDPEWMNVGSLYRCLKDRKGICWEIAGVYEYLLLQSGINSEDVNGYDTGSKEMHAWSFAELDGKLYHVDPTWGLAYGNKPSLKYFCFTDKERTVRDGFDPESCFVMRIVDMDNMSHGIKADDDRYAALWNGNYIGMDRTAKKIIYTDPNGVLCTFKYE
ncbi:MAG: hypothetical protein K6C69_00695 [Lachnospiraceae bacterium]|nr:hypothetical protein [Lachnospiraceae bacterium]